MIKLVNMPKLAAISLVLAVLFEPMAARALTTDQSALVQIANQYVTGSAGSSQSYVSGVSVFGTWALVGWTDNANSAGQMVASKASGAWVMTKAAGGAYSAAELQNFAGIDMGSAAFLVTNLRPLPPAGGPSSDASGTSTYSYLTCAGGTMITSDDSIVTYVTPSITPASLSQAVTIDITPDGAYNSAIVTLYGPGSQLIAQSTVGPGATGGVGYWNPNAPSGVYQYTVMGTSTAVTNDCSPPRGGSRRGTVTDALWLGRLAW